MLSRSSVNMGDHLFKMGGGAKTGFFKKFEVNTIPH